MNSTDIINALRRLHPPPDWAFGTEVGDHPGLSKSRRADAVAMHMWPSRGLAVHGFEVKVSRSDLKRELDTPAKADGIFCRCDFWWLATPVGLVKPDQELPIGWGLLEVANDGSTKVKRPAKHNAAATIDKGFMATFARGIGRDRDATVKAEISKGEAAMVARLEAQAKTRQTEAVRRAQLIIEAEPRITALLAESPNWANADYLVRLIQRVKKMERLQGPGVFTVLREHLVETVAEIDAIEAGAP